MVRAPLAALLSPPTTRVPTTKTSGRLHFDSRLPILKGNYFVASVSRDLHRLRDLDPSLEQWDDAEMHWMTKVGVS